MKKSHLPLFILCLFTVTKISRLNAQTGTRPGMSEIQNNIFGTEQGKKTASYDINSLEEINPKALKDFDKTYKNAENVSWTKTKDGFIATFISNDTRYRILYSINGKWSASVKGYHEEKLPFYIRDLVKSTYYDYNIFYIEELETVFSNRVPTYIIHIKDKNNIKLIRVFDREMEVWKDVKNITMR
jgi:hypothetical protein